jgi:flagellar basal-body rod protein FlgG
MIKAFYTATSGAQASQTSIDISANNLANLNTTGYKTKSASFSDILYTNINGGSTTPQNLQTGSGVKLQDVSSVFTQSAIEDTGHVLDVAIEGDGFFAVKDSNNNISYTRAGNFSISNDGTNSYLINSNGDYVLDQNLNPSIVNGSVDNVVLVAPDRNNATNNTYIKLGVFNFKNPYALSPQGESKYTVNNLSGQPALDTNSKLVQGSLEVSSVNMTSEMTNMIEAQRAFQFSAKMIQVADEIEQMANTLRG